MEPLQLLSDRAGKLLNDHFGRLETEVITNWHTFVILGYTYLDWKRGIALMKRVLERVGSGEGRSAEGICLPPPILGCLLAGIYETAPDEAAALSFLNTAFAQIVDFHRYLYQSRDPEEDGLLVITTNEEHLLWAIENYESDILQTRVKTAGPIQDTLYNALLIWSNECLIEIGAMLGENVGEIIEWNELTTYSFNEKLWNEEQGIYQSYNISNGTFIPTRDLLGALPLIAEIPDQDRAEMILDKLMNGTEKFLFAPPGEPTDPNEARAIVSVPANWLLYHGLWRYGMIGEAEKIRSFSLALVGRSGFREYYESGAGLTAGPDPADLYLPTAALYLAWMEEE